MPRLRASAPSRSNLSKSPWTSPLARAPHPPRPPCVLPLRSTFSCAPESTPEPSRRHTPFSVFVTSACGRPRPASIPCNARPPPGLRHIRDSHLALLSEERRPGNPPVTPLVATPPSVLSSSHPALARSPPLARPTRYPLNAYRPSPCRPLVVRNARPGDVSPSGRRRCRPPPGAAALPHLGPARPARVAPWPSSAAASTKRASASLAVGARTPSFATSTPRHPPLMAGLAPAMLRGGRFHLTPSFTHPSAPSPLVGAPTLLSPWSTPMGNPDPTARDTPEEDGTY
jgi:hypothetical protein